MKVYEFGKERNAKRSRIFNIIFFGLFLLFTLLLPLFSIGKTNFISISIITLIISCFWGFWFTLSLKALKRLPYSSIAIDDDGIWFSHLSKEKDLIPWREISAIKEHSFLQCLELLSSDKRRLIRIEYQVQDFEELRTIIVNKTLKPVSCNCKKLYSKPITYHIEQLLVIPLSILVVFIFIILTKVNIIIILTILGIISIPVFSEYSSICYKVILRDSSIGFFYPFKSFFIDYSDITTIEITDRFHQMQRYPQVSIISNVNKPIFLSNLGVDANILYSAIKHKVNASIEPTD